MIKAIGKLSYANSIAIREGKINGVMEDAIEYYNQTNREMTEFMQESAVSNWYDK